MDARTDARTDGQRENSIPPTNKVCGGYNYSQRCLHDGMLFRGSVIYNKTCLKWSLKIDKTKVLKTDGSVMQVESIAECSLGAFCNTFQESILQFFDLH